VLITLSERLLSERIRELENIPQFTVAEITSQMKYYGARLFQHIAEYGVYLRELCIQNGELGTFRFEIAPIYSDEDRATRFNGIRFMNPLSVTVEYSDLPGFFQNGLALTAAQEAFMPTDFQDLPPHELSPAIDRLAQQALFGPGRAPDGDVPAEIAAVQQEQDFQFFLRRAGLKDPLANLRKVDEYHRQEEAAVQAQREQAYEQSATANSETSFPKASKRKWVSRKNQTTVGECRCSRKEQQNGIHQST